MLDSIFGPVVDDGKAICHVGFNTSLIANLFDAAHHINFAVIAPPGMTLDESDEYSESSECVSSTMSEISMNDDLCDFFDNNKNLSTESLDKSHEDGETVAMKTPFSDHGSDDDFGAGAGAEDNLDFGTPCEMDCKDETKAGSADRVSDILKPTIVINGTKDASAPDGLSTKRMSNASPSLLTPSKAEERTSQVKEKENIDTQLLNSPAPEYDQFISELEASRPQHPPNKSFEKGVGGSTLPPVEALNEITDGHAGMSIQANKESDEYVDPSDRNVAAHEEVQSPLLTSFRLPTPPPSSDESDDDSSDPGSVNALVEHPNNDASLNVHQLVPNDVPKMNQFETLEIEENAMSKETDSKEVSFFQLPTQYSSSSSSSEEDDGDGSEESNERTCANDCAASDSSLPAKKPGEDLGATTSINATMGNNQGVLKEQSLPEQRLDGNPDTKHVQLKTTSIDDMSAVDLTDSPIKTPFPINGVRELGASTRMSLDSLTDTPVQCPKNNKEQGKSLYSLTDTPVQHRNKSGLHRKSLDSLTDTPVQLHKKSFESLTDTPAQNHQQIRQQRKRLKTVPKSVVSSKKLELGTAEKVTRKDRVKKRVEEKYRCRFLDTEAANDDSDESDEEDALKQIEAEEMSQ